MCNGRRAVALVTAGAVAATVTLWRRARQQGQPPAAEPAPAPPAATPAADPKPDPATAPEPEKPAAPTPPEPAAATEKTKADLYAIAQEMDVPGRSGMTKAQLIAALRERGIDPAA